MLLSGLYVLYSFNIILFLDISAVWELIFLKLAW